MATLDRPEPKRGEGPRYGLEDRQRFLQTQVQRWQAEGWRLETRGDYIATLTASSNRPGRIQRAFLTTDEYGWTDSRIEQALRDSEFDAASHRTRWRQRAERAEPVVVETYRAKTLEHATRFFREDQTYASQYGYAPTSQTWAQGQWGCGAFLIAVLLFVVLVGFLIFLYLLIVKPEGVLTVTYSRTKAEEQAAPERPTEAVEVAEETKTCPDCAETVRVAARICRYCRHEFWPEGEES